MAYTISIVIPYYCTPRELFSRCINSILAVDSDGIEIIVVDDGSPKEYYPVLNEFSGQDHVRIIHSENAGVSAARNRGIEEANGQWIMFSDSDDYMDSSVLNEVIDLARKCSGDIVIFSGGKDNRGEIILNHSFLKEDLNYAADEQNKLTIMGSSLSLGRIPRGYIQYFTLGSPVSKLIRREYLNQNNIRFDSEVRFAEDTLFSLNLFFHAKEIRYFQKYLYFYVVNEDSVTRRFRPGLSSDMDVFFSKTRAFLENNHLFEKLEKLYYFRAEFEISRVFSREFFHPMNRDKKAKAHYLAFIHKEPYKTALQKHYFSRPNYRGRIVRFIIEHGYGNIYKFIHGRRLRRIQIT